MEQTIDRRHALARLVAAGAAGAGLLAVPKIAKAAGLDAEVIALANRVKALSAEAATAYEFYQIQKSEYQAPPLPEELLIREGDEGLILPENGAVADRIGQPITPGEMKHIMLAECVFEFMRDEFPPGTEYVANAERKMARAAEIREAVERHRAAIRAVPVESERHKAWAVWNELEERVSRLRTTLAFTPARTVEGVLAKLGAVADSLDVPEPEDCEEGCQPVEVVAVALAELGKLRNAAASL